MDILGKLSKADALKFFELCERRGWIVLSYDGKTITYLDGNMDKKEIMITPGKTKL